VSAESEDDVAAELGTNCNLGKTIASVCPAWRCPHQDMRYLTRISTVDEFMSRDTNVIKSLISNSSHTTTILNKPG
jgi:hypothetical protein